MSDVRFLVPPSSSPGVPPGIGRGPYLEGQVWTLLPDVSVDDLDSVLSGWRWSHGQSFITTPTVEILKLFSERGNDDERVVVWLHQASDDFHVNRPLHDGRVATLPRGVLDSMFELVVGPRVVDVEVLEQQVTDLQREIRQLEGLGGIRRVDWSEDE